MTKESHGIRTFYLANIMLSLPKLKLVGLEEKVISESKNVNSGYLQMIAVSCRQYPFVSNERSPTYVRSSIQ